MRGGDREDAGKESSEIVSKILCDGSCWVFSWKRLIAFIRFSQDYVTQKKVKNRRDWQPWRELRLQGSLGGWVLVLLTGLWRGAWGPCQFRH